MAAAVSPNMMDAQLRLQQAMRMQGAGFGGASSVGQGIGQGLSSLAGALMQRRAMEDMKAAERSQIDRSAADMATMLGVGGGSSMTTPPGAPAAPMSAPATGYPILGGVTNGQSAPTQVPSGPDPLMWSERGPGNLLRMVPQSALRPGEQSFGVTPGTIGAGGMGGWFGGGGAALPPTGAPGMGMASPPGVGMPPIPTSVPYPTPGYNPQAAGPGASPLSGPAGAAEQMAAGPAGPPPWNPLSPTPIAQAPGIQASPGGGYYQPGSVQITPEDRDILIRTIYGEAANEPPEGKAQVAQVILNRASLGNYGGGGIRDVVLAPSQFEPWGNPAARQRMQELQPGDPRYEEIGAIVDAVAGGQAQLPAPDATHFYAPAAQAALGRNTPSWAQGQPGQAIGAHTFYDLSGGGAGSQPPPLPPEMMAPHEGPGAQYGFSPEAFGAQQPGATMQAPGMAPRNGLPPDQFNDRFAPAAGMPPMQDVRAQMAQPQAPAFVPTPGQMPTPPMPQAQPAQMQQPAPQPQPFGSEIPPVQQQGGPFDRIPMEVRQKIVQLTQAGDREGAEFMLEQALAAAPDEQWSEPFSWNGGTWVRDTLSGKFQQLEGRPSLETIYDETTGTEIKVRPLPDGSYEAVGGPKGAGAPPVQKITQPDGSEVAVQWNPQTSKWEPMEAPGGGAAVGRGPGKFTEAQSKDLGFYVRGQQALEVLDPIEGALTSVPNAAASRVPGVGNMMVTPEYQNAQQAAREFLASILRKDTGAAVTDQEFDLYGKIFLPQPGDGPDVIAQKRISRRRAMEALRAGLGPAQNSADELTAPQAPAGPDADGWIEVAPGIRMRQVQ